MEYEITVIYNYRFLFKTSKHITTSDALIKVFTVFLQKFPANEGYSMSISAYRVDYESINMDQFIEAMKAGKSKGHLMQLKNKRNKAMWMTHILFDGMKKGLI